jgi:hypothetical protein
MHMFLRYFVLALVLLAGPGEVLTQNYQAIHGSTRAGGSLTVHNNPASIVHIPFGWDVTVFSVQEKLTTNAFVLNNASLLNVRNIEVGSVNGEGKRFIAGNTDLHLLNARIRLDSRQAIAFGVNFRSAFSASTSRGNWQDTVQDLHSFLDINTNNVPFSATARASNWLEIFGSYARTIVDNGSAIINAGVTLSLNRGLGGAFLDANSINYFRSGSPGSPAFEFSRAELAYGYSANIDYARDNSFRDVFSRSRTGFSLSAGVEYIIPSFESESEYDYKWKIGASALDLGFSSYQFSRNSRVAVFDKNDITDSIVESRFKKVETIEEAVDTLTSLAGSSRTPTGTFHVMHPARVVINADRHLQGNFYLNVELTFPVTSILSDKYLFVKDINFLAVTPRYESRLLGAYLPVTFNTQKQVWIGGAFRAGPLILGVHNWANVFGKNKLQRGGFYLALTFRPGRKSEEDSNTSRDGGSRLSRKQRRVLDCYKF